MDMLSRPINAAARHLRCASSPVMRVCVVTLATTVASYAVAVRADPGYAIRSPDVLTGGLIVGDAVKVSITEPATALIKRTTVLLNGRNVTRSPFCPKALPAQRREWCPDSQWAQTCSNWSRLRAETPVR
jgi:hypothetical protein